MYQIFTTGYGITLYDFNSNSKIIVSPSNLDVLSPTNLLNKASGVLINGLPANVIGRKKRGVANSECATICERIKSESSKSDPDELSIRIRYNKCLKECPLQN